MTMPCYHDRSQVSHASALLTAFRIHKASDTHLALLEAQSRCGPCQLAIPYLKAVAQRGVPPWRLSAPHILTPCDTPWQLLASLKATRACAARFGWLKDHKLCPLARSFKYLAASPGFAQALTYALSTHSRGNSHQALPRPSCMHPNLEQDPWQRTPRAKSGPPCMASHRLNARSGTLLITVALQADILALCGA